MKFVEPIRDLNKISSMKKILFAQSERNYLLFTLGINSPYRISDLIRVQFKHVLDPLGIMNPGKLFDAAPASDDLPR